MKDQKIDVSQIQALRAELVSMYEKAKVGDIKLKDLKEYTNNVGKAIHSYKVEMDAVRFNRELDDIEKGGS